MNPFFLKLSYPIYPDKIYLNPNNFRKESTKLQETNRFTAIAYVQSNFTNSTSSFNIVE